VNFQQKTPIKSNFLQKKQKIAVDDINPRIPTPKP
jgi:hypothetical protein